MTMKAALKKAISQALVGRGFVSKGQSWYLKGTDTIVVLNLQKADHDEKVFVNFGIWIRKLGSDEFPAENKCHIQSRLPAMFPGAAEQIDRACRLDDPHADVRPFIEFLESQVVDFCNDCLSAGELRSRIERGDFRKALVMKAAKDALGLA